MEFKGRKFLLAITLVVMLMPSTALVLPTFLEINKVRLVNTPLAVILPYSFFPFGGLPDLHLLLHRRVLGSAGRGAYRRLRGAAHLPLHRPAPGHAGGRAGRVLQLRAELEQLLPALRDAARARGQYPMQVGLTQMLSSTPTFNPVVGRGSRGVHLSELALGALVSITPVLFVFLVAQRYLVAGLTAGATKG